jgi:hypothetical protein
MALGSCVREIVPYRADSGNRQACKGHKAHAPDLTVCPVSGSVMAIVVNLVAQGVLFVIELASLLLG